jgi:predicted DNA-binding transcriptional regulator AlpA
MKRGHAPIEVGELAPLLLTGVEAARLMRISRKTLWEHTAPRGSIRAIKFGKRFLRYSPAELQRWIAEQISQQPISGGAETTG